MRQKFTAGLVSLAFAAAMVFAHAEVSTRPAAGSIGASLVLDHDSGHPLVDYVAAGSPAALAGIKKGDWITAIDGAPIQGMSAADARRATRGEIGHAVTWTVRDPAGEERPVSIMRKSALDVYLPAATAGDPLAQFEVGYFYDEGPAPTRDMAKAFNWFTLAAAQDYPKAEYYLGMLYQYGHGVERDDHQAFHWYEQAARHDIAYAQWNLGYLYEKGLGVKRDTVEALKWYARAQAALPQNDQLRAHIALLSLQAFVENPASASLNLSLFMTAFRAQLMPFLYILLGTYVVGGVALFYFTLRKRDGPTGLGVALGWLAFDLEGQCVAVAALYLAGLLLTADNMFAATCLFSAVPVIVSTLGPNRHWMWRRSAVSGRKLLLYGSGAFAALFLTLEGYNQIYTLATHSAMAMQPTAVMISKAKEGSAWLTYACVAVALPMTEEILFRGYLFDALKRWCPDALVVILTAFAFALVHFQGLYFAPLFGFGLIQGWVKLRTGSLRLPVLLHTLNNGLFLALAS